MTKIRINELARELEVKAHEILDKLPDFGVTEKKTHSSSIDDDVALKLRRFFGHEVPGEPEAPETHAPARREQPSAAVEPAAAPEVAPSGPHGQSPVAAPVEEKAPETALGKAPLERPGGRPALPIRPPLAGTLHPSAPPAPAPRGWRHLPRPPSRPP